MRLFIAAAILLVTLGGAALHADPAADARRAIQAAYASMQAALDRGDPSGATAYFAPGFTFTDTHGRRSETAQQRQTFRELFAAAQSVSDTVTVLTFRRAGPDRATVVQRGRLVVILPAGTPTGRPSKGVHVLTARDFWVRTAHGWRVRHEQALSSTFTVNGKPLPDA